VWYGDPSADVKTYYLLKGKNPSSLRVFDSVAQKSSAFNTRKLTISEHDFNQEIQHYQITAINRCGAILSKSNFGINLLLNVEKTENGNRLSWSTYKSWESGIQYFEVYKGYDNGSGFTWNLSETTNDSTFIDHALDFLPGNEGVCYYVRALENVPNRINVFGNSVSNRVCVIDEMEVYIPNAVVAKNGAVLFEIKGIYIDFSLSSFMVFNRWGQEVFHTNDIRMGWDGHIGGLPAPVGTYHYLAEIFSLDGSKRIFKGPINLLR
jgi:hypothetical protein